MVEFGKFIESFTIAEEEIRFAEMAIGCLSSEDENCNSEGQPRGVVIPAINELRYVAKHLSNVLKSDGDDTYKEEHIKRAIRHCSRARLDALKAVVLYLAKDFYSFTSDYRKCHVPKKDKEILKFLSPKNMGYAQFFE